jgi:biopolymer transport protein ExbD
MIQLTKPRHGRDLLNITPLVDVVFLLLVFFLLTSTSIQRSMDVDLPQARSSEIAPPAGIVVSLLADGTLRLDRQPVSLDELGELLRARFAPGGKPALTIEADRRASFERFAQVLDHARVAGARQINLATGLVFERR